MVADPVELQILVDLRDALRGITIAGGYFHEVQSDAVKLDPDVDVDALVHGGGARPFIYIEGGQESWRYEGMPNGVELQWPITIHWVHQVDDPTRDEARMEAFLKGVADVEKAITVDIGRGGLARDHRITSRRLALSEDGSQIWAVVDTVVTVKRRYGQP